MGKRILKTLLVVVLLASAGCGPSNEQISRGQAHYKLGISHLNENSIQAAYVEFQQAVEIDPKNKEYLNALGIVYLKLSDFAKAEEYFVRSAKVDHKFSEAQNNLCYLYYTQKRWAESIERCKASLANPIYSTPEKPYYNLGMIYLKQKKYTEAASSFNEAIKRAPSFYHAYYGLALAYNLKGEYGEASTYLTRAIEFDPRFAGDRARALKGFQSGANVTDDPQDTKDILEILHY